MASIDTGGGDSGHKKGPGVKKAKKLSTRVDMTPMVDLGFLLITFFIFTTTMSTPKVMALNMPADTEKKEEMQTAKQSGALTILLGKDNGVYYYEGMIEDATSASEKFKSSNFDPEKGIRSIIIDKKKRTPEADFVVIIKPNEEATYKNTVDILDEMTINGVKVFALVKISDTEKDLIKATETNSGK